MTQIWKDTKLYPVTNFTSVLWLFNVVQMNLFLTQGQPWWREKVGPSQFLFITAVRGRSSNGAGSGQSYSNVSGDTTALLNVTFSYSSTWKTGLDSHLPVEVYLCVFSRHICISVISSSGSLATLVTGQSGSWLRSTTWVSLAGGAWTEIIRRGICTTRWQQ